MTTPPLPPPNPKPDLHNPPYSNTQGVTMLIEVTRLHTKDRYNHIIDALASLLPEPGTPQPRYWTCLITLTDYGSTVRIQTLEDPEPNEE